MFDLIQHLVRQIGFSRKTFGPGRRTAGVVDHIRKELNEIEMDPRDAMEFVDVVILGFDGLWRTLQDINPDATDEELARIACCMIVAKQTRNELRRWPDWRTVGQDKAIEHDRTGE